MKDVLDLPQIERTLLIHCAYKLEEKRWKRLGKMLGG